MKQILIYTFILSNLCFCCDKTPLLESSKNQIALSAIKGEKSKIDTLIIFNRGNTINDVDIKLKGKKSNFFKLFIKTPLNIESNTSVKIPIQFNPDNSFVGVVDARIDFNKAKDSLFSLPLKGLSTKGLEGKNEPPLSWVINTLGYKINLGWDALANHVRDDLQGDELPQVLFRKVNDGFVEMIPVARYSPAFSLPFGYYSQGDTLPVLHEVAVLSDSKLYPEHQTLFPKLQKGNISFNPKVESFGFYTVSPSHVAYSEDKWNKKLFEKHATHACRIYSVKNSEGVTLANQFLVCFEEAFNGDYQDYVFLVKNIEIVEGLN